MHKLRHLLALLLCGLCNCASQAQSALPEVVRAALSKAQIPESSFSALLLPLSGDKARLQHLADQPRAPGSTMKLLTTVAALDELGPTFRWHTQVLAPHDPAGPTLHGPLYLRGGGDPNLGWQRLQLMLRTLRAQGVRHLRGDIVLDRSYFSPARPDLNVPQFDESPDAYYNVIPDALLLESNLLDLGLRSDARRVTAQLRTPLLGVQLRSRQTLVDGDCGDWEDGWQQPQVRQGRGGTLQLTLQGTFPRHCAVRTSSNVIERNAFFEHVTRALWRELGGSWRGHVRDGLVPPDAKLLFEQASDTLADTVKLVNKRSDNAMARTLYLTLGALNAAPAGKTFANSFEAADSRLRGWMQAQGIATEGLVLDNGSGLSRSERISARQLAQVLQAGVRSLWFAEFATSLPIAGLDGTMRRRLKDTPAAMQARIKTGTLRDAVSVAGYVLDADSRDWIVVGIVNTPKGKDGRAALDALIAWAAEQKAPVPPHRAEEPTNRKLP